MGLQFPTGHRHPLYSQGQPLRARPCQCRTPWIDPVRDAATLHCGNCGKHLKQTINQTFHKRALALRTKAA